MKKLIVMSAALLFATSATIAQTAPGATGTETTGAGASVGNKESYSPTNPSKTPGTNQANQAPGTVGAGAAVGDKEGYNTNSPARTPSGTTSTNPGTAGTVGPVGGGGAGGK